MKNERFKQLKYNKARLAIMGQIAESGLKVGDRLPSVRSFAASLPYGAITISHALNDMKEEGMIKCRHGSGTYLARELKDNRFSNHILFLNVARRDQFIPEFGVDRIRHYLAERGIGLRTLPVYEFGLDKADPAANAGSLKTDPWTLKISGEVAKPLTLDHDDLTRRFPLEERIYRMRCVEAWSMVVPWIGFPLHKLLALAEPTSNAKYVAFETIYAPEQMPGQQDRFIGGGLKYPYVEGLRLDEAMHPLTLMTVGVYGKALPPQNGAPVRLIVPWKYGFKGIKSIVSIKLTRERPPTTWNLAAPDEYGFYANVNPHVDHPRWSQATERFIGSGGILNVQRQPTLLFNGYAEQVASLYRGLDLRENF